jgi:hypothetical protein
LEGLFGKNFREEFFWRNVLVEIFWEEYFWEEYFGRNSLFALLKLAKLFEYRRN